MASDDDMCPYPSDDELQEDEDSYPEEDAGDEGFGDEGEAEFAGGDLVRSKDSHNAQVLSEEEIHQRQERALQEVINILAVSPEHAAVLLRAYKWNVSHATDEWFADEERVRKRLGLLDSSALDESGDPSSSQCPADGKVLCGICFEEFGKEETSAAACNHSYCNECWESYFNTAVGEGQGCLSLRCPKPKCGMVVGDQMIMKLASPAQKAQFKKFILRSYVDNSSSVKWCPAPGCGFAVALDSWRVGPSVSLADSTANNMPVGLDSSMSANVECKCGHWFCWNCLEEPHRPVECDVVKKWLIKNSAESENMNWILANSKSCPKCKRPIEKNHGCMHMTCSAPCKYEFCWLCLGDWKAHSDATGGFYACNRYEEAKKRGDLTEEDQKKERAKQSLERYLHYYERWATNETSRKKAVESLTEVREKHADCLREMYNLPAAEMNFLIEGWQQIVECRRVLKWTYGYGFYLEDENEQAQRRRQFFEYLQGQADASLGGLHKCAEKDIESFLPPVNRSPFDDQMAVWVKPSLEAFLDFKAQLTHLTAVTKNYFDNLVKALESGLSEVAGQPETAGPSKGKGKSKAKDRRKKRTRYGTRKGGDPEDSENAQIDSGDEDLDSGEEGDMTEVTGGGASGSGPSGANGEDSEYWSCRHCTYANRVGSGNTCSMCRLPR